MSGQASPIQLTDALEAASNSQAAGAPAKVEPADLTHVNMTDYLQPASPSNESAFSSMAQPNMQVGEVHAATPEFRASAPTEGNEILNNLGNSLESVTNTMNGLAIPDMTQQTPSISVSGGKKFDPAAFEKLNNQMMESQRTLFNGVFEADERLQSATMGETMVANSATQTEKSMKQILNGQG